MTEQSEESKPTPRRARLVALILIPLVVLAGIVALVSWRMEEELPQVAFEAELSPIGLQKAIPFVAWDERSGLREINVYLRQEDKRIELFQRSFPREGYFRRSGPNRIEETLQMDTASWDLADGSAIAVVQARDYSWRGLLGGNEITREYPVVLDRKPPSVEILSSPRYITPGGAGIVLYRLEEETVKSGVMLVDLFHPGSPVSEDRRGTHLAYIGLPWDAGEPGEGTVMALDAAGNKGEAPFKMRIRKSRFKKDSINVTDAFLDRKLPEFSETVPSLEGTPIEQYLYLNGPVRKENAERIRELCASPGPERLWSGRFDRMPGSPMAGYGDHRTYMYQGRDVDRQVHLGVDVASVKNAAVGAANQGTVAFTGYLGIYGNTVIVDHGRGVFSLYSHLDQVTVGAGDPVNQGDELGRTGTTGMAGGDHLHFSMLINGLFVNPLEWWDDHWIQVNILDAMKIVE